MCFYIKVFSVKESLTTTLQNNFGQYYNNINIWTIPTWGLSQGTRQRKSWTGCQPIKGANHTHTHTIVHTPTHIHTLTGILLIPNSIQQVFRLGRKLEKPEEPLEDLQTPHLFLSEQYLTFLTTAPAAQNIFFSICIQNQNCINLQWIYALEAQ